MPVTLFALDTLLVPVATVLTHPLLGSPVLLALGVLLQPYAGSIIAAVFGLLSVIALGSGLLRWTTPVEAVCWWREIVLITGGSHGVGLGLVQHLLKKHRPKKVVVLDINPIDFKHDDIVFYRCDISNPKTLRDVCRRIIDEVGHPTMIVNNAGIVSGMPLTDLSDAQMERSIGVNLVAPMRICKEFVPGLIKMGRGHIVNVASVLGTTGAGMMTDYCASKFGLVGFSESLRQELAGTGVRCSTVYPGLIHTGMFDGVEYKMPWLTPGLHTDEVVHAIAGLLVANRSGEAKLPFFVVLTPLLRTLTIEANDLIRKITGANEAMAGLSAHARQRGHPK